MAQASYNGKGPDSTSFDNKSPDGKIAASTEVKTATLALSKGQILTIVLPVALPGSEAVIKEYYSKAFALARQFGLQNLFNLKVKQTYIGDIKAPIFGLFSWPDKSSEQKLLSHSQWPEIKAMRPAGWKHLNIFNTQLAQDINLKFSSRYHYTAVIAWFDPKHPDDYQQYLNNIEEALNDVGGKFILKLNNPTFESHSDEKVAPDQITFVQWQDASGFSKLQEHPEYKKHTHLFRTGLKGFEFYGLGVQ